MADRISLTGLAAHAHHGVYDWERERGQTFRVDAVLELDTRPAAAGDDLAKTVNYAELAQRLHAILTGDPVDLLETLAQRLADTCLATPLVDAVEITVHKPDAELGVVFDDVSVAIRRDRSSERSTG
jgi:7,8-dihydroneopterin aldolase/epimerase/oxygenase